jgi:nicotinamidase-related amidase
MKKLLIVIDMQNDFVFGSLGTKEAQEILPAVRKKIDAYRAAGDCIVFTADTHAENYMDTQEGRKLPVPHCIKPSEGWQIVEGLRQGERVFEKPTFGSEALAEFVLKERFDEVALIGVCTDICVLSNAVLIKTACPEIPVKVFADCCAGVSPKSHEAALCVLASVQVEIL